MIYQFNHIKIDDQNYKLTVKDIKVQVEPQVFNIIIFLIQNKDKVVTRNELLEHVWQGRVVSDTSINNSIKSARKALGDDGTSQRIIKTIHSRGYQFVAELRSAAPSLNVNLNKSSTKRRLFVSVSLISSFVFMLIFFWYQYQSEQPYVEQTIFSPDVSISTTDPEDKNKPLKAQKLIAVLPFSNTKPNIDTDYLGFALANQIIGELTYLEKFSIRQVGLIRKYVDKVIDPITVGQELKVDYVVSGNYLLENDVIRLSVEMIEVNNSHLVWRESMQVDYSNTFDLQDMVAQKVAKGLEAEFRPNFINQRNRDIPNSALAYEYYLRGISYPQSNEGHKLAVEMLQKSIELDPLYAPSYAHLGFHRRLLEQHGRIVPFELKKAQWYYQKALELNPNQLDALSNLSALYVETNRIEEALLIIRKMLEIAPNDANSLFALGYIYRYAGMLDESIDSMEKALEISPNNTRFRSIISTYASAGLYEQALAKVYLDPGDYGTGYSGIIAFSQGKNELAQTLFNRVVEIDENGIWSLIAQVYLAVMDGDKERGLIALSKMVDTNVVDAENMYYFANFYALLKEKEQSLNMLEQAVNSGYFNYPHISHTPSFNYLHDDARYISILQKAKQRHDNFRHKFL
jgi:DNA-binding winged helix-turn-helix (wHTH) protein/tetratricopeptide (TPR) repeat protein